MKIHLSAVLIASVSALLAAGARAQTPELEESFQAAQAAAAAAKPVRAEGKTFTVELKELYPMCDHFLCFGCSESPQHVYVTIKIVNKGAAPLPPISIEEVYVSFDPAAPGEPVKGLSFSRDQAPPAPLAPGAAVELKLSGDGLFPEGKHGQRLYVTITVSAGGEKLTLSGSETISSPQ